jgi:hypothetical protein
MVSSVKKGRKRKRVRKTRKMKGGNSTKPGANQKYKKLKCSPNPEKNNFSCFSNPDLIKLRDRWNLRHPDVAIKTDDPKEIWTLLKQYLSNVCNKETCWLKQNFMPEQDGKELLNSFAPQSPADWKDNPNKWLSSLDILNVMRQYEKAYKCFEFLGPSPIDYDTIEMDGACVFEEICNLNLKDQIQSGKTKLGFSFNTDTHDKPGKHWITMFVNIKKGLIYFFDSAGNAIPTRLKKLVKNITKQGLALNPPIKFAFDQNHPVEHQYGTTECGIYSLYFIVHMLEDKLTAKYLKTHIITDEYVNKFRKIYFNQEL